MNKYGLERYKKLYETDRFYQEVWEGEEYAAAIRQPRKIVLDVGSLAGEFSIWIETHGAEKIYAIEPYKPHYEELEMNIRLVKSKRIKPFNIALSDTNGEDTLHDAGRGGHFLGGSPGENFQVETKTLATFMKENNIDHVDVLKIDIENGEGRVFRADDFKDVVDKIDFIIGEHLGDVNDMLIGYGFTHKKNGVNVTFERVKDAA